MTYNFSPEFERTLLYRVSSDREMWEILGRHIQEKHLSSGILRVILRTCRDLFEVQKVKKSSCLAVLQRLRKEVERGALAGSQWEEVAQIFDDAEDGVLIGDAAVVAKALPIVLSAERKKTHHRASIKDVETTGGVRRGSLALGPLIAAEIESYHSLKKLPTGIREIDARLGGGVPCGTLNVVVMESGGGKSMWLSYQMAECVQRGQHVLYATLELPPFFVHVRSLAALTGKSINGIMKMPKYDLEELIRKTVSRISGSCEVREFAPRATYVRDIRQWVDEFEEQTGLSTDLLIVDYGDRLGAPGIENSDSYRVGEAVFEEMRRFALERKMWIWTASQASRGASSGYRIDLDHVADSMHKMRIADFVVTGRRAGQKGVEYFVAKNRHGDSRFSAGPYESDFRHGRIIRQAI